MLPANLIEMSAVGTVSGADDNHGIACFRKGSCFILPGGGCAADCLVDFNVAAKTLQYVEQVKTVTAEKERISAELNMATAIQASQLPRLFPAFPDRPEYPDKPELPGKTTTFFLSPPYSTSLCHIHNPHAPRPQQPPWLLP